MGRFENLRVFDEAHVLALNTGRVAKGIRSPLHDSLRNQMVRAAGSVPANIVEGRECESEKDFRRFLRYALASAGELEYHLLLACQYRLIDLDDFERLTKQTKLVKRMLRGLIRRLSDRAGG
jgi:four helix bundle protein